MCPNQSAVIKATARTPKGELPELPLVVVEAFARMEAEPELAGDDRREDDTLGLADRSATSACPLMSPEYALVSRRISTTGGADRSSGTPRWPCASASSANAQCRSGSSGVSQLGARVYRSIGFDLDRKNACPRSKMGLDCLHLRS